MLYNLAAATLRSFSLRLTSKRITILLIHYRCELDLQRTSSIVNTEDASDTMFMALRTRRTRSRDATSTFTFSPFGRRIR